MFSTLSDINVRFGNGKVRVIFLVFLSASDVRCGLAREAIAEERIFRAVLRTIIRPSSHNSEGKTGKLDKKKV